VVEELPGNRIKTARGSPYAADGILDAAEVKIFKTSVAITAGEAKTRFEMPFLRVV
jgi:hypothetical protein